MLSDRLFKQSTSKDDVEYWVSDTNPHAWNTHRLTHTQHYPHRSTLFEVPEGPALPFTGEDGLGCGTRLSGHDPVTTPVLGFVTGLTAQQHLLKFAE